MEKIMFIAAAEDGTVDVETVWAEPLGECNYKILNLLFFAYDVSVDDIVYAALDPEKKLPVFSKVIKKSGNRTLRMMLRDGLLNKTQNRRLIKELSTIGCGCEGANSVYFAINVPPTQALETATQILDKFNVKWEFADPASNNLTDYRQ